MLIYASLWKRDFVKKHNSALWSFGSSWRIICSSAPGFVNSSLILRDHSEVHSQQFLRGSQWDNTWNKNTDKSRCWWGCGATGHSCTILETSLAVSDRRAHLCEPAIKILGIYPREIKPYVHKRLVQECFWLCCLTRWVILSTWLYTDVKQGYISQCSE